MIPAAVAGLWAVAVACSGLGAQKIVPVVELDAAGLRGAKIAFERDAKERVAVLNWGEIRVPLAEPVASIAAAWMPGRTGLVVLAGGVRDSLDLYLIRADGEFARYATEGGRHLPREFNDGSGSWPVVEGRHLLLFAYRKGAGIEFRALDFRGAVLFARTLPANVTGWQTASDPDKGEVRLGFGEAAQSLVFRHPLAPRLELKSGLLQFGTVEVGKRSRQMLELTNRGRRPLRLRMDPPGAGFEIVTEPPAELAPGRSARLRVDFVPARVGAYTVRLKIFATGVVPEHIVRLVGEAVSAATAAAAGDPEARPPLAPVAPPMPVVEAVAFYPRGAGVVLVCGRVSGTTVPRVELRAGPGVNLPVTLDAEGRFEARLPVVGRGVELCAVAGPQLRSKFVTLGTAPAMLEVVGDTVRVRALPDEEFILTARSDGDVLRRWRGRTGAGGQADLPLAILGEPVAGGPPITLEVTVTDAGRPHTGRAVQVR